MKRRVELAVKLIGDSSKDVLLSEEARALGNDFKHYLRGVWKGNHDQRHPADD